MMSTKQLLLKGGRTISSSLNTTTSSSSRFVSRGKNTILPSYSYRNKVCTFYTSSSTIIQKQQQQQLQKKLFSTWKNSGNSLLASTTARTSAIIAAAFMMMTVGSAVLMSETEETDFYEYRYITTKDPDDLAGFYGSEQFMEIFCVMPFMSNLMMRKGYFDDEGTVHTTGFPGEMLVNMVFSDKTSAEGKIRWFNKRERFRSICGGYTAWDMVCNFGFEDLGDGRVMVYHHGAYFKSSLPPVSWLVRKVFGLHAKWVAWAAEHHVNNYFAHEEDKDEEASRVDMPMFLLKNYNWTDLLSTLLGFQQQLEKPTKETTTTVMPLPTMMACSSCIVNSKELPIHQSQVLEHIAKDIQTDIENSKMILVEPTIKPNNQKIDLHVALQRSNTTIREDSIDTTTGPKAYKAATVVAQHRLTQRRHDHVLVNQRKSDLQNFCQSLSLLYLDLDHEWDVF